jgi:hypothetical protein
VFKRRKRKDLTQSYLDQAHSGSPAVAEPVGSLGEAVDEDTRTNQLLDELGAIASSQGFLTTKGKDPRTRAIGAELDRMNGMQKMLDVHKVVAAEHGRIHARSLEAAWDGIGSWRG